MKLVRKAAVVLAALAAGLLVTALPAAAADSPDNWHQTIVSPDNWHQTIVSPDNWHQTVISPDSLRTP
ncbi:MULTISPECIES: hypothetical protein [unclassified Streptomyces]|uniref:hypothetical protein n=1 Tax=unclassified Streptomyces TaxID=2593676 RepID=UPI003802F0B4